MEWTASVAGADDRILQIQAPKYWIASVRLGCALTISRNKKNIFTVLSQVQSKISILRTIYLVEYSSSYSLTRMTDPSET
jgi:hypothetical protein